MAFTPFAASVDKLTMVAYEGFGFVEFMNSWSNEYISKRITCAFPYRYLWQCADGTIIQWGNETKKVRPIRIEFNPNKCDKDSLFEVLKRLKYPELTRTDLAFDFEEELSEYLIIDGLSRKSNIWRSGSGKLETFYIGAPSSDLRIRIYNKALEQNMKDAVWWRIEAQLRKGVLDKTYNRFGIIPNPFDGLTIQKEVMNEIKDIKKRAMAYYLMHEPNALGELSHPTRYKYKKLLADLAASKELKIDMDAIYSTHWSELKKSIDQYVGVAKSHDIILID